MIVAFTLGVFVMFYGILGFALYVVIKRDWEKAAQKDKERR
jgi:vacuolar-type H+-ATPase subunit I/STV1